MLGNTVWASNLVLAVLAALAFLAFGRSLGLSRPAAACAALVYALDGFWSLR